MHQRSTGEPPAKSSSSAENEVKEAFANYKTWKPTTHKPILISTKTLCLPAQDFGPHDERYIHVYVSPNARDWFLDKKPKRGPFPEGTVIVKEKRDIAGDKPVELGVMIKREKGSFPKAGDWQYLFVERDGQLVSGKRLQNRAVCHSQATNDSVFGAR